MARKTREEAEKTRYNILEAALDVFARKGFTRTTLSDIAVEAGFTRGAIYWHFKDKVDLFMALAEEIEASAGVRPQDLRTDAVQSLGDLKQEIVQFLAHFARHDRYAVFYEVVSHRTELTAELEPVLARQRADQREILRRAKDMFARLRVHGLVRHDLNPEYAAAAMMAFVVGLIEIWIVDRSVFSIEAAVPAMLEDFLRGMQP